MMDLTKLLKDKEGIELYSPIFRDCQLCSVNDSSNSFPIEVTDNYSIIHKFTKEGYYTNNFRLNPECVLFPSKENRDWNNFDK